MMYCMYISDAIEFKLKSSAQEVQISLSLSHGYTAPPHYCLFVFIAFKPRWDMDNM